jgi:hypothetical protein
MDILYISSKAREYLLQYCDEELVNYVFADFQKTGKIVDKEEGDEPYRLWIITDYIKRNDINVRKKLAVILSMASSGFVQVGETKVFGDVPLMLLLHKLGYLTYDDMCYFSDYYYNHSIQVHGLDEKFTM